MISKTWNKLVKIVNQYFAPTMIVTVIVYVVLGEYHKANYFLLLFLGFSISEGLSDLKKSVDLVWYRLYMRNHKDGIE